jgi:hypothetical protein
MPLRRKFWALRLNFFCARQFGFQTRKDPNMHVLQTMVANDPGGRVTVTFLGDEPDAVEVHMAGSADLPPREYVKKAKAMLIEAAAVGDGMPSQSEEADALSAAPIAADKRDPFAPAPEENDDNAFQSPDEALPDDKEEAALDSSISREGSRFDQIIRK